MQTETQTREEWLAGLKVGDEVAVPAFQLSEPAHILTIEGETPTQWKVGDSLFSKADGYNVGDRPWNGYAIIEPVIADERARIELDFKVAAASIDTYSTATLEAAIAVLKGESRD